MGQTQKDIVRRHGLAAIGALAFSLLLLVSYALHLTRLSTTGLIALLTSYWLVHGLMLYWVYSGRAAHLRDPSLTVPFMLWVILFISVALIFTKELRPVLMLAYLAVMPFGVFRLSWKGYLGICLFTMSCYSAVVMFLLHSANGLWLPEIEAFLGATFCICILTYTLIGREFSVLRNAYKRKNQELRRAMTRIEELAITDELTGLYNRRYLLQMLEKHQALANREQMPFVLAFVDIDQFKQINDHHGHRIGDQVLAELSLHLKHAIREVDLAARYGGEEFVLLLSGLVLADAGKVLERIRVNVTGMEFSEAHLPLTVSIGVAEYHPGEKGEELLNRADRLLYKAKESGRNQVKMESLETPFTEYGIS